MRSVGFFLAILMAASVPAADKDKEQPFYLTIDAPPAPELSAAEALETFSIAPGFRIDLVAAEPLVEDPVAMTWDEHGNLYVVEMRGYMPDAWGRGDQEPVGVVTRLTDIDRDGVFDEREVLIDGLVLPRAIAVVNAGLIIGEPPNLWLCPTDNGDSTGIDCQKKIRLGDYGNLPGGVEHAENGLMPGLDNWIYNAKSDRRLKLRGDELIIDQTLFRGQWGITQDNEGRLYYNTNSNLLLGELYDPEPVLAAGNSGAAGLNIPVSKNDQVFAVRVNPGVNRAYVPGVLREDGRLNKPTSASGMVIYRGDQFPQSYRQDAFVTEPAANAVVQLRLNSGGLVAETEHVLYPDDQWGQREFMASTDERFRPVDVEIGPDGALYVIDMYRGIIQDQAFISEELRAQVLDRGLDRPLGLGRIWRISSLHDAIRTGDAIEKDADLLGLLGHRNGWHRDTAQRLLAASNGRGIDKKLRRLVKSKDSLTAVHAIWTLEARGGLDRRTVMKALDSDLVSVRLAALKAGQALVPQKRLMSLAESADQEIAQHATLYLGRYNKNPQVIELLARLVGKFAGNEVRLAALQAAASGSELALAGQLTGVAVSAAVEPQFGVIQHLMTQSLRGHPENAPATLDAVFESDDENIQRAMLQGLAEAVRDDGFQRIELAAPHHIFTSGPEQLWPGVSKVRIGFTWPGDDLVAGARPLSPEQSKSMQAGKAYFLARCAICHGVDGKGIATLAPPLTESEWVTGPTERLLRIILHGLQGPITVKGQSWNGVMPGHDNIEALTDDAAGGLLTYLGRSWGHRGRTIDSAFVRQVRDLEVDRDTLWTVEELMKLDINTHYRAFAGSYGGGPFKMTLTYNGRGLDIESVYFNGPLVEIKEDQFLFEARKLRLEFNWEQGKVTGVRLPDMDGTILPRIPAQ